MKFGSMKRTPCFNFPVTGSCTHFQITMPPSALLSAYWEPGMSQSLLRLPLLVLHVAGLGAIFLAARRLCGRESALIALALYGGSWATLSFVLELRGYGLSMVLSSLQMCGALAIMRKSAFSRYMLYFLPAWASLAVIPSNALAVGIISLWTVLQPELRLRHCKRWEYFLLLCAPFLALALYIPHWEMIQTHTSHSWSPWGRTEILLHWLETVAVSATPILMFFLLGLYTAVCRATQSHRERSAWLLLAITILASVLFVFITPRPAFPRTLLAVSPLLYLAMAPAVVAGLNWMRTRVAPSSSSFSWCIGIAIVTVAFAQLDPVRTVPSTTDRSANLRFQPYNEGFSPARTLGLIMALTSNSSTTVYTGVNGWYELSYPVQSDQLPIRLRQSRKISVASLAESATNFLVVPTNRTVENATGNIGGELALKHISQDKNYAVYQILEFTPITSEAR
jgi:hypothetical protein